jgi:hypothetical protein
MTSLRRIVTSANSGDFDHDFSPPTHLDRLSWQSKNTSSDNRRCVADFGFAVVTCVIDVLEWGV